MDPSLLKGFQCLSSISLLWFCVQVCVRMRVHVHAQMHVGGGRGLVETSVLGEAGEQVLSSEHALVS